MRLNAVIFSLLLACLSPATRAQGAETARRDSASTRYEKMAERRMATWQKLIPDHYKTQFAGSIGVVSLGPGWTYGRKQQWETDLMFVIGFMSMTIVEQ